MFRFVFALSCFVSVVSRFVSFHFCLFRSRSISGTHQVAHENKFDEKSWTRKEQDWPWQTECPSHSHLFHSKHICPPPSSSLLQGKHLPFTPSPLRFNMFRLFVNLSLTQLYRYAPEIFLFSTATFKYTYRGPLRRIGQDYSAKVAWWKFKSLKRIQPLPVCAGFFICIRNSLDRPCVTMSSWSSPLKCKVSL